MYVYMHIYINIYAHTLREERPVRQCLDPYMGCSCKRSSFGVFWYPVDLFTLTVHLNDFIRIQENLDAIYQVNL